MKLQIISDLHLVSKLIFPKNISSKVILAGDIVNVYNPKLLSEYVSILSKFSDKIYFVAGNHEFIKKDNFNYMAIKNDYRELENKHNNFYFLDNQYFIDNNNLIFGSTFPTPQVNKIGYDISCRNLNKTLSSKANIHIIISHYAPLFINTFHPKWGGNMLLTKFCFNSIPLLERCQANKIVWIFGHTHYGCDFTMNLGNKEIRFISNPYKNENLNKPFTEEEFELN